MALADHFNLRLVISQFDFEQYSKCLHTVSVDVPLNAEGVVEFQDALWEYKVKSEKSGDGLNSWKISVVFTLVKGHLKQCNVAVETVFSHWSVENYVLMPAAAYNGNRFQSRRIAYSPKLLDPRDVCADKPPVVSDVPRLSIDDGPSQISDRSGAMSTPSIGFFSPHFGEGFWMLFPQRCHLGDFGCSISENRSRDKATFRIAAPVVREQYKYRITDNQFPSDDRAPDLQPGDQVEIPFHLHFFVCPSVQHLFDYWNGIRYNLLPDPGPVNSIPFSSTFPIQEEKFNLQNWVESKGYYSVGMREMFLQDWQVGWTGGMISTYPLLALGSQKTRERVLRNFDFLFPEGISPSGFFYDCGELKGNTFHWYGGDIRKPHTANWHLVRKSGDALYYILKQFWLMEAMGMTVKEHWKEGLKTVANAFVKLWTENRQTGNYVDSLTGKIIVGGSTSAGIVPAGLAYAAKYFNDTDYLVIAREIAEHFYQKYITKGLTMGGVGDAMQNPDSESAYGVFESFAVLYEQTGKLIWLERAEQMASQFFTWVIGYNYEFPEGCTLGQMKVKTMGAVWANTQNKHGSPGICTFSGVALLRLFRATGKDIYRDMLCKIARFIPQMLCHPGNPIEGMQNGWMTERVSTTDWFEGIGELMMGSTWAETALMLTTLEIPAIYILPDKKEIVAFDSLDTCWIEGKKQGEEAVKIKNNSTETADVKIMAEDSKQRNIPLGENYFLSALKTRILPGQEIIIPIHEIHQKNNIKTTL